LHGAWRDTVLWQLLSSSWLFGGLLTLAALARCRVERVDDATMRAATIGRRTPFWRPVRPRTYVAES
jgi:hypothetical protein